MEKRLLLVLLFVVTVSGAILSHEKPVYCQDKCYSAVELISNCRCSAERHDVTTDDGYLLQIQRVHNCQSSPRVLAKPVVLMVHGIFSTANDFVLQCNQSLGFRLAEMGYDVWLGNVRGNPYSRSHVQLNPDLPEFWDFSWHEMGLSDLPAMMDYITSLTGQERMTYVAHSQGTTSFFVMCSLMKNYCRRIRAAVAMAPLAYMDGITSNLLNALAKLSDPLTDVIGKNRDKEILPHTDAYTTLAFKSCCISELSCRKTFTATNFNGDNNIDTDILPQIMCYNPTGSSLGTFSHYLQLINSGEFQHYDWGKKINIEVYESLKPPIYPLCDITCPVYMVVSENDQIATYRNARRACEEIGDNCELYLTQDASLSHMDFVFSRQAPYEIYNDVVSYIESHSPVPHVPRVLRCNYGCKN